MNVKQLIVKQAAVSNDQADDAVSADVAAKAVALHDPGNAAQMPPVGLKHDHRPTPLHEQVGGGQPRRAAANAKLLAFLGQLKVPWLGWGVKLTAGGGAGPQFRNAGLPSFFRWAAMPGIIAVSASVFIPSARRCSP